jgi:hypothetical protein
MLMPVSKKLTRFAVMVAVACDAIVTLPVYVDVNRADDANDTAPLLAVKRTLSAMMLESIMLLLVNVAPLFSSVLALVEPNVKPLVVVMLVAVLMLPLKLPLSVYKNARSVVLNCVPLNVLIVVLLLPTMRTAAPLLTVNTPEPLDTAVVPPCNDATPLLATTLMVPVPDAMFNAPAARPMMPQPELTEIIPPPVLAKNDTWLPLTAELCSDDTLNCSVPLMLNVLLPLKLNESVAWNDMSLEAISDTTPPFAVTPTPCTLISPLDVTLLDVLPPILTLVNACNVIALLASNDTTPLDPRETVVGLVTLMLVLLLKLVAPAVLVTEMPETSDKI